MIRKCFQIAEGVGFCLIEFSHGDSVGNLRFRDELVDQLSKLLEANTAEVVYVEVFLRLFSAEIRGMENQ